MILSWHTSAKCSALDVGASTRSWVVRGNEHRVPAVRFLTTLPRAVASYTANGTHQSLATAPSAASDSPPHARNGYAATPSMATPKTASVKFCMHFKAEFGQRIRIVGASPEMGEWDHAAAPEMEWSEGHIWHITLNLPQGSIHEYKFVLCAEDGITPILWQKGNNAVVAVLEEESVEVHHEWAPEQPTRVVADGQECTSSERIVAWGGAMSTMLDSMRRELKQALIGQANSEEAARVSADALKVTQSSLDQAKQLIWVLQQTKTKLENRKSQEENASKSHSWNSATTDSETPKPARSWEPNSTSYSTENSYDGTSDSYSASSNSYSAGYSRSGNGASHADTREDNHSSAPQYDWGSRSFGGRSYAAEEPSSSSAAEDDGGWGRPVPKTGFFGSPATSSSYQPPSTSEPARDDDDDTDNGWGRPVKSFW